LSQADTALTVSERKSVGFEFLSNLLFFTPLLKLSLLFLKN